MSSNMKQVLRYRDLLAVIACALLFSGCSGFPGAGMERPVAGYGLVSPPLVPKEDADSAAAPPVAADEEKTDWLSQLSSAVESITEPSEDHSLARRLIGEAEQRYNRAAELRRDAVSREQLQQAGALYLEAAGLYEWAAENWSDSALQEDARYMAGECYFFIDYYDKANESYEKMLEDYPNSRYMDIVQQRRFSMADFWLKDAEKNPRPFLFFNFTNESFPLRDNLEEAIRVFDKIRLQDPTGKIADDATMIAALALIKKEEYERADTFLTDLRRTFAGSEHQFMAHYLGIHTKLRSYQGAWYSGIVLDEAEKLVQRIRRQFPLKEKEHRQEINRMHAEIRFRKAEREWAMAQFYDHRNEIGAARIYYTSVLHGYPDTPFAERAIGRLKEVENMPAKPPQYLTWLVNLFPVEEPARPLLNNNDAVSYEP